ncbi:zinc finger protein 62 homolog [Adelges cooleyi]|uniref:zinc finger protein 62 homolog n=1 Tax=Adelges cooleyi TaxID=133065 RepID=UPI00217F3F82|nr:zinc finger protein 62 homolog [Adelges cooleyi]XP_050432849.1 zinc finger protein 62 homolog [Adelges cooleyi]XP_050432850.1 zinc finger protein 62 homolog [Adelges cooleyi]
MNSIKIEPLENNQDFSGVLKWVENTAENRSWYSVNENCVSLVTENDNKVIKWETDSMDDCSWQSFLEIPKVEPDQNSSPSSYTSPPRLNWTNKLNNATVQNSTPISQENKNTDTLENGHSVRENYVIKATEFLNSEAIKNSPMDKKVQFLRSKGLSDQETKLALNRLLMVSDQNHSSPVHNIVFQPTNETTQNILTSVKDNKLFHCDICGENFKLNFGLNRHMKKSHGQQNTSIYSNTNTTNRLDNEDRKSVENNSKLSIKLLKSNGIWQSKVQSVFKCKLCLKQFDIESNLVQHMAIHTDPDAKKQCKICLNFFSSNHLFNHMQQMHNSKVLFKCEHCGCEFSNKNNFNCHVKHCTNKSQNMWKKFKVANNSLKQYQCKFCKQLFTLRRNLLKHIKIYHKNVSDQNKISQHNQNLSHCELLNKVCDDDEIPNGNDNKEKQASVCSNNVNSSQNLYSEIINKSTEVDTDNMVAADLSKKIKLECEEIESNCNYLVIDGLFNQTHVKTEENTSFVSIKSETDSTKYFKFACNLCTETFFNKHGLAMHLPTHEEYLKPKVLECYVCNKQYETTKQLKDHLRYHERLSMTDPKPSPPPRPSPPSPPPASPTSCPVSKNSVLCDVCNKVFKNRFIYANHRRHFHKLSKITKHKTLALKHEGTTSESMDTVGQNKNTVSNVPLLTRNMKRDCTNHEKSYTNISTPNLDNKLSTKRGVAINNTKLNISIIKEEYSVLSDSETKTSSNKLSKERCSICDKYFGSANLLQRHMLAHSNDRPYKCQYCDLRFKNRGNQGRHELVHTKNSHAKQGSTDKVSKLKNSTNDHSRSVTTKQETLHPTRSLWFGCDICDKKFCSPKILFSHRVTHINDCESYKCCFCDNRTFTLKHNWIRHLDIHYKNKIYNDLDKVMLIYKCRCCKKEYKKRGFWHVHLLKSKQCRRHSNAPDIISKLSGKMPATSSVDKTATDQTDGEDKETADRVYCNLCDGTFAHVKSLRKHQQNVHSLLMNNNRNKNVSNNSNDNNKKPPNKVQEVLRKFKNWKQRENANVSGRANTKLSCDVCGKIFIYKLSLVNHKKTHMSAEETYECKDCGKKFNENTALGLHILEIHCSKPDVTAKKYTCDICFRVYENHQQLICHKEYHSSGMNKPFSCKECQIGYVQRCGLLRHLKAHHST